MQGLRIKGYLAMLERRPEEAVTEFRRAHQLYPRRRKNSVSLMDACFRDNQPAEAEKVGLDFIGRDPKASDIYDALFRLDVAENRLQDAENILARKVNANPKGEFTSCSLASFYASAHRKPGNGSRRCRCCFPIPAEVRRFVWKRAISIPLLAIRRRSAAIQRREPSSKNDSLLYQNRIARRSPIAEQPAGRLEDSEPDPDASIRTTMRPVPCEPLFWSGEPAAGKSGEGVQQFRRCWKRIPTISS